MNKLEKLTRLYLNIVNNSSNLINEETERFFNVEYSFDADSLKDEYSKFNLLSEYVIDYYPNDLIDEDEPMSLIDVFKIFGFNSELLEDGSSTIKATMNGSMLRQFLAACIINEDEMHSTHYAEDCILTLNSIDDYEPQQFIDVFGCTIDKLFKMDLDSFLDLVIPILSDLKNDIAIKEIGSVDYLDDNEEDLVDNDEY